MLLIFFITGSIPENGDPKSRPGVGIIGSGDKDDEIHLQLAPATNQTYGATLTTEQLFIVILAILASIALLTGKWSELT